MQFYLAPMEGLTGYVYRSAYHKYFPAADRYFTPFITNKKMTGRQSGDGNVRGSDFADDGSL